jgi:ABC-type multidrug transport system fused ATPase/permease subunit
MKSIFRFTSNSWTMRIVAILTILYIGVSLLFEEELSVSSVVIFILTFTYFVYSFGKTSNYRGKSDQ